MKKAAEQWDPPISGTKGLSGVSEGFKHIKARLTGSFLQNKTAKDRSNQCHVVKYGALHAPVTGDGTSSRI
jgi:hypothetical protein